VLYKCIYISHNLTPKIQQKESSLKLTNTHKPKLAKEKNQQIIIPVRSPVMRTRDGLIILRAGPTILLKSRALSGWWTLK
jgi:hypothetical protein